MAFYEGVFFDFDYTLGDATACIQTGFYGAFEEMGLPRPDGEAVRRTIGMTLEDAYTLLSGDGDEGHRALFRKHYVRIADPLQVSQTKLFPGAEELLDWLYAGGIQVAVVSTKRRATIRRVFDHYGLSDRLSLCVGGEDIRRPKPDPEGALLALERLDLRREQVLFVGDTLIDAETARRAGLDFAAVCNGTTPAAAFSSVPHVHIAPDLKELQGWLEAQRLSRANASAAEMR
ncbi:MAG: HAD family hydrolase [Clostridiales bacterium]|nr:HAD family hydrolase [Clostridiales bacterium]